MLAASRCDAANVFLMHAAAIQHEMSHMAPDIDAERALAVHGSDVSLGNALRKCLPRKGSSTHNKGAKATLRIKIIGGSMTGGSMNDCYMHRTTACRTGSVPWGRHLLEHLQPALPLCTLQVVIKAAPATTARVALQDIWRRVDRLDDIL